MANHGHKISMPARLGAENAEAVLGPTSPASAHASAAFATATAPSRRSRMNLMQSFTEIADGCCAMADD
jgi:hypothetical protein